MTDVTGSLKSSNMSKMNYFFPWLSFLFLPTSCTFKSETWHCTLSLSSTYNKSQPCLFPPNYLPKYPPFLPLRALVQALIFHWSHSYNSLLSWFLFSDLTWSNLFSHRSSHSKTQMWPHHFPFENTSTSHLKILSSSVNTSYMVNAPSAWKASFLPFPLCSGLGSSRKPPSVPRQDHVTLPYDPLVASQ